MSDYKMGGYKPAEQIAADMLARRDPRDAELGTLRVEVERLKGALRHLYHGYVRTLETGRDRIIDLGGACDPVDTMEEGDPCLVAARAALEPTP
jgi:hypothetical protein